MKGNPKYHRGEKVFFQCDGRIFNGSIYIIDRWGCFEDDSDVCYDIMVQDPKYVTKQNPTGDCLFKHINEKTINV